MPASSPFKFKIDGMNDIGKKKFILAVKVRLSFRVTESVGGGIENSLLLYLKLYLVVSVMRREIFLNES